MMRRDQYVEWLRRGLIPQHHLETEDGYHASRTIGAYAGSPFPNAAPVPINPYWYPTGPTRPEDWVNLRQNPPRMEFAPDTPIPSGLVPGSYIPPGMAMEVQIPGTDQTVQIKIPQDQAGFCACIVWLLQMFEQRTAYILADVMARQMSAVFNQTQQNARLPSHINKPFTGPRADVCTAVDSPVSLFGSGFAPIVTRTIPDGEVGVVSTIGVELDSPAGFDDVVFRLVVNGDAVQNMDDIRWRTGSLDNPIDVNLSIPGPATVVLEGQTLTLTSSYLARGALNGWNYTPVMRTTTGIEGTMPGLG